MMFWFILLSVLVGNEAQERGKKKATVTDHYPGYNLYSNYFPYLYNEVHNAIKVENEQEYPWMARVVHSRNAEEPYLCSAVLIDIGIFLTAARCLTTLKIDYTTVIYDKQHWKVKAFVLPSIMTNQGIDDNGLVVVDSRGTNRWNKVMLHAAEKRADEKFEWFEAMVKNGLKIRVIGFGHEFVNHTRQTDRLWYMDALTNIDMCPKILTVNDDTNSTEGYKVPCYHGCNYTVNVSDSGTYGSVTPNCLKYLGVLGAAVMDIKTTEVLGVATWGAMSANPDEYYLPVGYSIANTAEFYKDFFCAKLIQMNNVSPAPVGHYQELCRSVRA